MIKIHWFLPTGGDVGYGADGKPVRRKATAEYLESITVTCEALGYEGFLVPAGMWAADGWVSAATMSAKTERIKFMIALRPGFITPPLVAQMTATFEQLLPGRMMLNIVTGGDSEEQRRYGDQLDKNTRYERTDEFLDIVTALWRQERVTFAGRHYNVADAWLINPPVSGRPHIYTSGSSQPAVSVAAKHADTYMCWGEAPPEAAENIEAVRRKLSDEGGRTIGFGTRFSVLSRETEQEAWQAAEDMLAGYDKDWRKAVRERMGKTESEGQRRMTALTDRFWETGDPRDLIVAPNIWAGLGLIRGGVGTMLVGSHAQVANVIAEYHALGFSEFILGGTPHLEEAVSFGEGVLPILEKQGLWQHPGRSLAASAR